MHSNETCISNQFGYEIRQLDSPLTMIKNIPATKLVLKTVHTTRKKIQNILLGLDDSLLVVIGPCSIHYFHEAMEYANRLAEIKKQFDDYLLIVMRLYFEKPRTKLGWKGLMNDPDLNQSFNINKGIKLARELLVEVNKIGIPASCEFLNILSANYISDLISWGAIGARTVESQVHRELASSLSCPIGFKNRTDGNIKSAIDAILTAARPHHFISINNSGYLSIISSSGNKNCHIVLRGGENPNYDASSINSVAQQLEHNKLSQRIMIDVSHANSQKVFSNQLNSAFSVAKQIEEGDLRIFGIMIESYILEGNQELLINQPPVYGKSITDQCISWESSVKILELLAQSVKTRRTIINKKIY